jgi:hypothetical protein
MKKIKEAQGMFVEYEPGEERNELEIQKRSHTLLVCLFTLQCW